MRVAYGPGMTLPIVLTALLALGDRAGGADLPIANGPASPRNVACSGDVFGTPNPPVLAGAWSSGPLAETSSETAGDVEDFPNLVVLADDGRLMPGFDLDGRALRFTPSSGAGYVGALTAVPFDPELGSRLDLGAGRSLRLVLPQPFPFFDVDRSEVFVNANGTLTFEDGVADAGEGDAWGGPARIAALWDDLDPAAGDGIWVSPRQDRVVITWLHVPEAVYGPTGRTPLGDNTVQVTLELSSPGTTATPGTIRIGYYGVSARDVQIGISPGPSREAYLPNLSELSVAGFESLPVFEIFPEGFDSQAVAEAFYASHPDDFDFVIAFPASSSPPRGNVIGRFHGVRNEIRGVGQRTFDASANFGGAGRLQGFIEMLRLGAGWPASYLLSVLAHEVGHRWIARIEVRKGEECTGDLSTEGSHWAFLLDTDGSYLSGRDWTDRGGGRFDQTGAFNRYSALDLYLMGLVGPEEVRPTFLIDDLRTLDDLPCSFGDDGCTASVRGTKRPVPIDDITACSGARLPSVAAAQREFRMAFALVVPPGESPDPAELNELETIRQMWAPYWSVATRRAGVAHTALSRTCGDGHVNGPDEVCDAAPGSYEPGMCRPDCLPAHCGDGIVDFGEDCDDARHATCCSSGCTMSSDLPDCALTILTAGDPCLAGELPNRFARRIGHHLSRLQLTSLASSTGRERARLRRRNRRQLEKIRALARRASSRKRHAISPECGARIGELVDRVEEPLSGSALATP